MARNNPVVLAPMTALEEVTIIRSTIERCTVEVHLAGNIHCGEQVPSMNPQ